MNKLHQASSPYLRQHADNPVHWYEWGEKAFQVARSNQMPILVSIGYSTCHWCHVMAHESFEDEAVADIMNQYFVNIKIDREERPDLDRLYMDACQIIAGTAGWPLNVFLTPDLKPFHAGTYFPIVAREETPSWMDTLQFAAYNFYENRTAVEAQADKILLRIQQQDMHGPALSMDDRESAFSPTFFAEVFDKLANSFDSINGGFGQTPKFPNTMALEALMMNDHFWGDEAYKNHLLLSVRKMLRGGIYDQIGGGIARYATDSQWLVPHFEKMLYDNALLIQLLGDTYRKYQDPEIKDGIVETVSFVLNELACDQGGFYAALDADSDGIEGKYYTWSYREWETALGSQADLIGEYYPVTAEGNWEETNILARTSSNDQFAKRIGMDLSKFESLLASAKNKLILRRTRRSRPHRDDKVLLDWNAMMVVGLTKAYWAIGRDEYKSVAKNTIDYLLENFIQAGQLLRVSVRGQVAIAATLSDYAHLIHALLSVYELDFQTAYLDRAKALTEQVIKEFEHKESPLFYDSSERQTDIVLRKHNSMDTEIPSGNAMMVMNLQRLGLLFDEPAYLQRASQMLLVQRDKVAQQPLAYGAWLSAMVSQSVGLSEIAIVGANAPSKANQIQPHYLPNKVLMASTQANDAYPLLKGKLPEEDAAIFVCKNYACQQPVKTVEAMLDDV